jgi:uncharacterized membrane protein
MLIKIKNINKPAILKSGLIILSLVIVVSWLDYAPPGLLGKMDAVGYAVCHRIDLRSFHLGDRAIPLCARCSGMHLGTLLGFVFQWQSGRKGKFPPKKIFFVLAVLAAAFVTDGINSYLHFFPGAFGVYDPHNWLRLVTGTGLGLGIAAVLYPVFNQTIWNDWIDQPAISGWKDMGILIGLAALLDLVILSENPIVLYPLAILSGLAVLLVLTLCYALLVVLLSKKENTYSGWKSSWIPLLSGNSIAIFQVYLFDFVRFSFTGTWGGFIL